MKEGPDFNGGNRSTPFPWASWFRAFRGLLINRFWCKSTGELGNCNVGFCSDGKDNFLGNCVEFVTVDVKIGEGYLKFNKGK